MEQFGELSAFNTDDVKELVKLLNIANTKYRNGIDFISDKQFDELEDKLKSLDPTNSYFDKIGLTPVERKVQLPVRMGSMNKVKTTKELKAWFKHKKIPKDAVLILSPKLDGCSILNKETTNYNQYKQTYTRGDGIYGQTVTENFRLTLNRSYKLDDCYTIGEAIIRKNIFVNKFSREVLGEEFGYANARNMVSSLFNSKTPKREFLKEVMFVRYGLFNRYGVETINKIEQFQAVNEDNIIPIPFVVVHIDDLTDQLMQEMHELWAKGPFEIDGIIVELNGLDLRKKLGREDNGNPAYARAYKGSFEEIKPTIIKEIDWQIGKTGQVTPVAYFEPVKLEGGMVKKASLYNAKYLIDNKIDVGTEVLLKRSGGVIPKIVEITKSTGKHDLYNHLICYVNTRTSGVVKCIWDETKTNINLEEPNDEQRIQQIVFFFETMGVEDFGEPTIRKFYEAGFKTVGHIINMDVFTQMCGIQGIGMKTAEPLKKQFEDIFWNHKKYSFAKLADASCCFDGLGEKTLTILEHNSSIKHEPFLEVYLFSGKIHGIGEKTRKEFFAGFRRFAEWLHENQLGIPEFRLDLPLDNQNLRLKDKNIVFTGFRDDNLEQWILCEGGNLSSSVSKNTHLVIIKDQAAFDNPTSKLQKAMDLGLDVKILSCFKRDYGII